MDKESQTVQLSSRIRTLSKSMIEDLVRRDNIKSIDKKIKSKEKYLKKIQKEKSLDDSIISNDDLDKEKIKLQKLKVIRNEENKYVKLENLISQISHIDNHKKQFPSELEKNFKILISLTKEEDPEIILKNLRTDYVLEYNKVINKLNSKYRKSKQLINKLKLSNQTFEIKSNFNGKEEIIEELKYGGLSNEPGAIKELLDLVVKKICPEIAKVNFNEEKIDLTEEEELFFKKIEELKQDKEFISNSNIERVMSCSKKIKDAYLDRKKLININTSINFILNYKKVDVPELSETKKYLSIIKEKYQEKLDIVNIYLNNLKVDLEETKKVIQKKIINENYEKKEITLINEYENLYYKLTKIIEENSNNEIEKENINYEIKRIEEDKLITESKLEQAKQKGIEKYHTEKKKQQEAKELFEKEEKTYQELLEKMIELASKKIEKSKILEEGTYEEINGKKIFVPKYNKEELIKEEIVNYAIKANKIINSESFNDITNTENEELADFISLYNKWLSLFKEKEKINVKVKKK